MDKKSVNINDYEQGMYRYFCIQDQTLYCSDVMEKLAVKWDGNGWLECPYAEILDTAKEITFDEALKISKTAPWEAFASIKAKQMEYTRNYWENLIKTTTKNYTRYRRSRIFI